MSRLFSLSGKTAVVVGGTPIGRATAALLEDAGAEVALLETEPAVAAQADRPPVDVEDEASIIAAFAAAAARRPIDIVVYAATRTGTYPFAELTASEWDRMQSVNLRGAFLTLREAVRHMKGAGGRIVAVSTMGSLHPVLRGNAAYGASKAGLNALVRSVALDHAGDGILVNAVLHGAVPGGPSSSPHAPDAASPARQPGRLALGSGTAEDVAAAILFLVSPAGKFITGQNLTLDGGFLVS